MGRCVVACSSHRVAAGDDQAFGIPVPQGRRAHTECVGKFGDAHRVRASDIIDRFGADGLGGVLGVLQFRAFCGQSSMCRIEQGERVCERESVNGPNDFPGFTRFDTRREGSVGQRRLQMQLAIDPVAGSGACRRWQHACAFEIANLLHGTPGPARDIDRAQTSRFETWNRTSTGIAA